MIEYIVPTKHKHASAIVVIIMTIFFSDVSLCVGGIGGMMWFMQKYPVSRVSLINTSYKLPACETSYRWLECLHAELHKNKK